MSFLPVTVYCCTLDNLPEGRVPGDGPAPGQQAEYGGVHATDEASPVPGGQPGSQGRSPPTHTHPRPDLHMGWYGLQPRGPKTRGAPHHLIYIYCNIYTERERERECGGGGGGGEIKNMYRRPTNYISPGST